MKVLAKSALVLLLASLPLLASDPAPAQKITQVEGPPRWKELPCPEGSYPLYPHKLGGELRYCDRKLPPWTFEEGYVFFEVIDREHPVEGLMNNQCRSRACAFYAPELEPFFEPELQPQ